MSKITKKASTEQQRVVLSTIVTGIKSNTILSKINKMIDDYSDNLNAYSNLMEYFSCVPNILNPKNPFNSNDLLKKDIASGIEIPGALISLKFYQNNYDTSKPINPDEVFTNFDSYYDSLIEFEKISKTDSRSAKKQYGELTQGYKDLLSRDVSKEVVESFKGVTVKTFADALSVLQGIETFNTFANEQIKMINAMGKDGYKKFQIEKIQKAMLQMPRKKAK